MVLMTVAGLDSVSAYSLGNQLVIERGIELEAWLALLRVIGLETLSVGVSVLMLASLMATHMVIGLLAWQLVP